MNDLTNPLQSLLAQASKIKAPATASRATTRQNARGPSVILADVSGSMEQPAAGARTKCELLESALRDMRDEIRDACVFAFNSSVAEIFDLSLPPPSGGTDLVAAIERAAALAPSHTLVISDGQPDDERGALAAAERLTGVIDALYVGHEDDHEAIAFMRQLVAIGAGRVVVRDVTRRPALTREILKMLPPPVTR